MQANITFKNLKVLFGNMLLLLFLLGFVSQKVYAQPYVNGNLSTGATASNGTAAPAGYTWSELQNDAGNTTESNTNLGFGASITNGTSLADDFTVPVGQSWTLSKITVYAYSTGYTGTTSPFTDLRLQIHNGNPLNGPTTVVFGNLTTNRLSATSNAFVYRTGNTLVPTAATPGTTRRIWKLEATVVTTLTAGTYWIEWQSDPGTLTSNFTPASTPVGARTQPGYNAIQNTGTWAALTDAGNPAAAPDVAVDIPFIVDYSTGPLAPPSCATNLSPANNATGISINGAITWTAAAGASSYDVYFGTSSTPSLVSNVTGTSYTFSPALTTNTQYYYQIVPKNSGGAAVGCVTNTFTTTNVTCLQPTLPALSTPAAYCSGTTGASATINITAGSLNGATNWVWYTGTCGGTAAGTGTSLTVTPSATTTYYVRGEGGCVGVAGVCASVVVTVNQTPGIPVVNAITPSCIDSIRTLEINPVAVSTNSVTVNSAALSIAVPDNVATGASTTLVVPALPAGAVVSGIDVKLNMTHTYPGDMIFNLKAPNNQILNLYKYANGAFTGNNGSLVGAGWFNAVTSSTGTVDYGSIGLPYAYGSAATPGPFAPDLFNAAVTGVAVQNPAGFVAAAPNFSALYSVPAGTWTLAMADGGLGDIGTLTSWSITIKYTISTTAFPAVWSPASTLYTDPAATNLYNGTTPLFKVYAKPAVTTTYSAISQNGTCVSPGPASITVTVNVPIRITGHPVSDTICEFGSTKFTAKASGTTPHYQWLVNTGTGAYNPISDGANYSGTGTDTLTVTGAPYSWNGYQYRCLVSSATPCPQTDTTRAAVLTVNPTPVVSLSAAPYTRLMPGLTSTITVSSAPAARTYSWFKDGIALPSVTTGTFPITVDDLGIYKVTVVDVNGCTNTSATIQISDTVSNRLFIYPNPAPGGRFQVRFYSVTGNVLPRTMMIYDSKGALVLDKSYSLGKPYDKMDVDFGGLGKGVYFIDLLSSTGIRLATGKVLVQ